MNNHSLIVAAILTAGILSTSFALEETNSMPLYGSRENPIPIGMAFQLDNGWQVKVLSIIPNANELIRQENNHNARPESGYQYFIAELEIKNNGTDVIRPSDAYFNVVGNSSVAYEHADERVPNPIPYTDVFPGGTVAGNICWAIRSSDCDSLTMYHNIVEPYVFFSLT